MNYNQTKTSTGNAMPLIMGCTMPTRIQEAYNVEQTIYDPVSQKSYDMRLIGTYSLKTSTTKKGVANITDKKNAIDDQKVVK
jgi:hypothetical protein